MRTLSLAAHPSAVRDAREFARGCCVSAGVARDVTDTVMLLISEAVTNAFVRGRSDARLRVTVTGGGVRVEVSDDNSRYPRHVEQDDEALDGRGMVLMTALARQWGVREEELGKTVWLEIARLPAASGMA